MKKIKDSVCRQKRPGNRTCVTRHWPMVVAHAVARRHTAISSISFGLMLHNSKKNLATQVVYLHCIHCANHASIALRVPIQQANNQHASLSAYVCRYSSDFSAAAAIHAQKRPRFFRPSSFVQTGYHNIFSFFFGIIGNSRSSTRYRRDFGQSSYGS